MYNKGRNIRWYKEVASLVGWSSKVERFTGRIVEKDKSKFGW